MRIDITKTPLSKYKYFIGVNLPFRLECVIEHKQPDVVLYYVESISDLMKALNESLNHKWNEKRLCLLFKKKQKSFHMHHIMSVIDSSTFIKKRQPMMKSIDNQFSFITIEVIRNE
jgi:hypothetical protein